MNTTENAGNAERVNLLIAEYQACHSTRDHYDSVRWTMGSIFLASFFALLGLSFIEEVSNDFIKVFFIGIFSITIVSIWHAYNQHVNPYVMASILRCRQIETELQKIGFEVKQHELIVAKSKKQKRGAWITYFLLVLVVWTWIFRWAFFLPENEIVQWTFILSSELMYLVIILCLIVTAVLIYIIQLRFLNDKKVREEIIELKNK